MVLPVLIEIMILPVVIAIMILPVVIEIGILLVQAKRTVNIKKASLLRRAALKTLRYLVK